MVLSVCRRVLRDPHEAEDVLQAVFLVLARKAASICKQESVGCWLHGVAHRLALKAKAETARRRNREAKGAARPFENSLCKMTWEEIEPILDEELGRLADKHRAPLVLCYLEGKTRDEAAQQLGWSIRTLLRRLREGRELLRGRLTRRGVTLGAALITASLLTSGASAAVPKMLLNSTIKAAMWIATGGAAGSVVSAKVAALTQGVLRTMFLSKLKVISAGLLIAGLLVCGVLIPGLCALPQSSLAQQPAVKQQEKPPDKEPAKKAPDAGQDGVKVVKAGKYVNSLAYCNDGKTMAIVIWNGVPRGDTQAGSVVLWDLQQGKVQQTLEEWDKLENGTLQFWHVTSSKDGTTIAASGTTNKAGYGAIRVWEAKTGKLLGTFEFSAQVVGAVALSADGKKVAGGDCVTGDGEVCVWDVPSGNLLKRLPTAKMDNWSLALSEDGKWIAAGGWTVPGDGSDEKNKVIVWGLESGKVKYEWSDNMAGSAVTALAFSPDGKLVAAGWVSDKTIRVWDMQTGKLKHQLNDHIARRLAFSPDSKTLASAGTDGKIILWDVAKEKARDTLPGRAASVLDVVFSPDGRTLASGGSDGAMRFCPIAQPKK
jgi:RNA polymerase sigma factor (sigma-70 family)